MLSNYFPQGFPQGLAGRRLQQTDRFISLIFSGPLCASHGGAHFDHCISQGPGRKQMVSPPFRRSFLAGMTKGTHRGWLGTPVLTPAVPAPLELKVKGQSRC